MKKQRLIMWLPLALLSILGISLGIISCNEAKADKEEENSKASPVKVLYVTHEPGKHHKYTPQREVFTELAKAQKWELTVISGSHNEVIKKLSTTPDFGNGYDVIVYNFCFAKCADLNVPYNIITQTKEKGIPALLIHCSLHSFWPTYKEKGGNAVHSPGAPDKAHTRKNLLAKWNKEHPGKAFPAWPTFTGISSTGHGRQAPIQTKAVTADHAILKNVPEYKTVNAELYNNFINQNDSKDTTAILEGIQGKGKAIVLWEHPVGGSKAVSFTLGHGLEEWRQESFQKIIVNSVKYLATLPKEKK